IAAPPFPQRTVSWPCRPPAPPVAVALAVAGAWPAEALAVLVVSPPLPALVCMNAVLIAPPAPPVADAFASADLPGCCALAAANECAAPPAPLRRVRSPVPPLPPSEVARAAACPSELVAPERASAAPPSPAGNNPNVVRFPICAAPCPPVA